MNSRKLNIALLIIMLASAAYLSVAFAQDYRQSLADARDEVTGLTNSEVKEVANILDSIDFDVKAEEPLVEDTETVVEKAVTEEDIIKAVGGLKQNAKVEAKQQINKLIVDSMSVDSAVYLGDDPKLLDKGIWHIPGTSTPDKGGNTVMAAHRWKWGPQSGKSFYDIDKVAEGDIISVIWEGQEYSYKVSKITTVTPDKVEILNNTAQPKLTLFSCAPLFSSKYRLVVEADLIS